MPLKINLLALSLLCISLSIPSNADTATKNLEESSLNFTLGNCMVTSMADLFMLGIESSSPKTNTDWAKLAKQVSKKLGKEVALDEVKTSFEMFKEKILSETLSELKAPQIRRETAEMEAEYAEFILSRDLVDVRSFLTCEQFGELVIRSKALFQKSYENLELDSTTKLDYAKILNNSYDLSLTEAVSVADVAVEFRPSNEEELQRQFLKSANLLKTKSSDIAQQIYESMSSKQEVSTSGGLVECRLKKPTSALPTVFRAILSEDYSNIIVTSDRAMRLAKWKSKKPFFGGNDVIKFTGKLDRLTTRKLTNNDPVILGINYVIKLNKQTLEYSHQAYYDLIPGYELKGTGFQKGQCKKL